VFGMGTGVSPPT